MDLCWNWLFVFTLLTPSLASSVPNPTKRKGAGPLFRIHRQELWGFMDRSGTTVIPPRFAAAGDFFNGLAWAREEPESKCGYINLTGGVVIPYQFDDCRDFSEGVAAVRTGRGWGFIDATGRFQIPAHLKAAADFHEGLARFEEWETIQCLDDPAGPKRYRADNAPDWAFMLHDGRSSTDDMGLDACMGGLFGFLDHSGKVVIAPTFKLAWDFSEGRAVVRTDGFQKGFIDKTGKIVVKPQFDSASDFSEGLASVGYYGPDGRFGYIDSNGTVVIPIRFVYAGDFSEGLAPVNVSVQNRWGFIDHRGVFVIPPKFASATPFSEGFAVVFSDDILGSYYVDKQGRFAFAGGMNPAWPFVDGLAVVSREQGLVYLNRVGKVIETYEFFRRPRPQ